MPEKWKILSEEDVSPDPWFRVLKHVVELPGQKIVDDYFIAPFGNAVMILPFTHDKNIVLVKQYKHGIGEVIVELPAGVIQDGKSLEESALAELEEETGIKTTLDNLKFIGRTSNNPTKTNQVTHSFLALDLTFNSKQHFDETEDIELIIAKPSEVLQMITNGEIWTGDSVATILKAHLAYPQLFLT